ncbi:MAG TPA: ABC transporter transmembrane domain-containing protein [Candidatus Acidoferrales bacterium]|jgi:subfamily B ATP-binding cassette protein MsbA|nr:ABC transporter transmembrane domain-containing protein [Candidatus Acidoferrales bacterium]
MKEVRRLLSYGRRYWAHLLASVFLMALAGASTGATALLIRPIFDRVLVANPPKGLTPLLQHPIWNHQIYLEQIIPIHSRGIWFMVAAAILLVFLVKGICDYLGNYLISYAGFSSVTDLRNAVFEKVLKQGAQFFEAHSTGQLMSSIMNDVDKVQVATSQILADFLRQIFAAIFLIFVLLTNDWHLAVISLVVLPAVMIPTTRIGRRIRRTSRNTQDRQGDLNQILQETLSGHMVVKAFGAEGYEFRRFREAARRLLKTNVRYVLQQGISSPLIDMCAAAVIVGLLTYAKLQIKAGTLTAGDFTSFIIALLMLLEPVKRLVGIHNIFQQGIGASQKVFEYLDHAEEVAERSDALPLVSFEKHIVFEKVAFHYPGAPDGFRIQALDLEVKAGEVVALVGPSGGGKTTLANLVPRFYDVAGGAVKIDGRDVRSLSLAGLRRQIGIVAQDTFLFNDTVANNIAYGQPEVGHEAIRRAAETALAHDFITRLPRGYDTVTGDRGIKLSGGQRQRIAIARALLKNAPILILDEATSHLDTESEMLVQKALANLMEHRTVIVIAHRLSTIRRADKIVVLEKGQIRETGTHEQLVSHGGMYQRLYELQFEDVASMVDL